MAYEEQIWDTTSYVTPTRMNHIEEGIYNNSVISAKSTKGGTSQTYEALLNSIYSDLNALSTQELADGVLNLGGLLCKCARKSSTVITFHTIYTQESGNMRFIVLNISSSGSTYLRVTISTTGTVTYTDNSSATTDSTIIFYGRG